ncbi:uncharacterized protein METZ01_LOCUS26957, partial [marine metagenome]
VKTHQYGGQFIPPAMPMQAIPAASETTFPWKLTTILPGSTSSTAK